MPASPIDSGDVQLGLACAGDARALAQMSRDLIESGLGWAYRAERIARMIDDPDTVSLVARHGSLVAAFAMMSFGVERAHLVLLAVSAAHQRRGIARRMIDWLRETAVTAGIASIHVELRAGNPRAHAFYRTAGFTEILRLPGYYRGRETAIRMTCLLRTNAVGSQPWRPPTLDRRN